MYDTTHYLYDVHILELLAVRRRRQDVNDADHLGGLWVGKVRHRQYSIYAQNHKAAHIFMGELLHELDLAQNALSIDGVFEGTSDLLDGDLLTGLLVLRRDHYTVGSMAYRPDQRVARWDLIQ